MSYEELWQASRAVATSLLPGEFVCLFVARCQWMIVAIMGVAVAGCAYVPMDTSAPDARLSYIFEDCGRPLVLTTTSLVSRLQATLRPQVLVIERLIAAPNEKALQVTVKPNDALYIFYTSGTTGEPKGVIVEHFGLVNRIDFLQATFPMKRGDCVLQKAYYGFGISEWEIFWPLLVGRRLALADAGAAIMDPEYVLHAVDKFGVTHLFCVPTQLETLIEVATRQLTRVRYLFAAGEALRYGLCSACHEHLFGRATIVNLFGPTEADMTYFVVHNENRGSQAASSDIVPAGLPIFNSRIELREDGEICFIGPGVARSYLNRVELNAAKFSTLPNGDRLYRTGDRGRIDKHGVLHFLGRTDRQVKVRGVRVELGEVESALLSAGAMRAVVELVGDTVNAELVAWISPAQDADSILNGVRVILPAAEVPSRVVGLDEMPLTTNGKVDKRALKAALSHQDESASSASSNMDTTTLEGAILASWADVLGRKLPATASFSSTFDSIGATSLLIGRLVSRLRKTHNIVISMTDVFTYNTAAKLACRIREVNHSAINKIARGAVVKRSWHGERSTRPVALLANLLTFVVSSVVDIDAGLPAWLDFSIALMLYARYHFMTAWILATAASVSITATATLIAVLAKSCSLGKAKPGDYPIFGTTYLAWLFATTCYKLVYTANRDLYAETPLMVAFYRSFGANCPYDALIDAYLYDPDLVVIGTGVHMCRDAVVSGHVLTRDGLLRLRRVNIGAYCVVGQRAFVVAGTTLDPCSTVRAMATTDGVDCIGKPPAGAVCHSTGPRTHSRPRVDFVDQLARCVIGVPVIALARQLPTGLALISLSRLLGECDNWHSWWHLVRFCWLYSLLSSNLFFWLVAISKRTPLLRTSSSGKSRLDRLRRWVLARLVDSQLFEEAVGPWINTEVLAWLYRCLGAHIGRRVQMDAFYALDHELVSVGNNVVFGHGVTLETSDEDIVDDAADDATGLLTASSWRVQRERLEIADDAQVLDHCHLELASTVERGALVGSTTLIPRGYVVQANSTSMGNVDHAPVVLRSSRTPPQLTRLQLIAKQRHDSTLAWGAFNCWNAIGSLLLEPLITALWLFSAELAGSTSSGSVMAVALFPFVEFAVMLAHCTAVCLIKWLLIGKYQPGDHPFYGTYHGKWAIALLLARSLKPLIDNKLCGTPFISAAYRAFGAYVGADCCLMVSTVEYDLLRFGDRAVIGFQTTIQPHTVEHMVINLGTFTMGTGATLRHQAAIMPDVELEDYGQLLENSLLPKGCVVAAGTTWAGLPAKEIYLPREDNDNRGYKDSANATSPQNNNGSLLPPAPCCAHSGEKSSESSDADAIPLLHPPVTASNGHFGARWSLSTEANYGLLNHNGITRSAQTLTVHSVEEPRNPTS